MAPFAPAQTRVQRANLQQDMQLLRQEVGRLRLEVEALRREKTQLAAEVRDLSEAVSTNRTRYQNFVKTVQIQLDSLEEQLAEMNRKTQEEIVDRVTRQIETFGKEIDKGFVSLEKRVKWLENNLGGSAGSGASSSNDGDAARTQFPQNFPTTGVSYTVKSGDNIWSIARALKSKANWIINANEIARPEGLQVGTLLFVPQRPSDAAEEESPSSGSE